MRKYIQGKFTPSMPEKYAGDLSRIVYRSRWEKNVFRWCDLNPDVISWASEEVVVPYVGVDEKLHRYFIDLCIKYKSGQVVLVEIKPKAQTREPKPKQGKRKTTLIQEAITHKTNEAKWKAANMFAQKNNMTFQVWHEDILESLGIAVR